MKIVLLQLQPCLLQHTARFMIGPEGMGNHGFGAEIGKRSVQECTGTLRGIAAAPRSSPQAIPQIERSRVVGERPQMEPAKKGAIGFRLGGPERRFVTRSVAREHSRKGSERVFSGWCVWLVDEAPYLGIRVQIQEVIEIVRRYRAQT
jgi:hypothetical protein